MTEENSNSVDDLTNIVKKFLDNPLLPLPPEVNDLINIVIENKVLVQNLIDRVINNQQKIIEFLKVIIEIIPEDKIIESLELDKIKNEYFNKYGEVNGEMINVLIGVAKEIIENTEFIEILNKFNPIKIDDLKNIIQSANKETELETILTKLATSAILNISKLDVKEIDYLINFIFEILKNDKLNELFKLFPELQVGIALIKHNEGVIRNSVKAIIPALKFVLSAKGFGSSLVNGGPSLSKFLSSNKDNIINAKGDSVSPASSVENADNGVNNLLGDSKKGLTNAANNLLGDSKKGLTNASNILGDSKKGLTNAANGVIKNLPGIELFTNFIEQLHVEKLIDKLGLDAKVKNYLEKIATKKDEIKSLIKHFPAAIIKKLLSLNSPFEMLVNRKKFAKDIVNIFIEMETEYRTNSILTKTVNEITALPKFNEDIEVFKQKIITNISDISIDDVILEINEITKLDSTKTDFTYEIKEFVKKNVIFITNEESIDKGSIDDLDNPNELNAYLKNKINGHLNGLIFQIAENPKQTNNPEQIAGNNSEQNTKEDIPDIFKNGIKTNIKSVITDTYEKTKQLRDNFIYFLENIIDNNYPDISETTTIIDIALYMLLGQPPVKTITSGTAEDDNTVTKKDDNTVTKEYFGENIIQEKFCKKLDIDNLKPRIIEAYHELVAKINEKLKKNSEPEPTSDTLLLSLSLLQQSNKHPISDLLQSNKQPTSVTTPTPDPLLLSLPLLLTSDSALMPPPTTPTPTLTSDLPPPQAGGKCITRRKHLRKTRKIRTIRRRRGRH